jgi:hypothetical protein
MINISDRTLVISRIALIIQSVLSDVRQPFMRLRAEGVRQRGFVKSLRNSAFKRSRGNPAFLLGVITGRN